MSYLSIVPTTVFSHMTKEAPRPVSWITTIGSVGTLAMVAVGRVEAQRPVYAIDSTFVGSWTPYLTKDTSLAQVLTLRPNGRFVMRDTETHESFSGVTHVRVAVTGEWRVRGAAPISANGAETAELCLEAIGATDMECESVVKIGKTIDGVDGLFDSPWRVWKIVEHPRNVSTSSHIIYGGLTRKEDSMLTAPDPIRPPFSSSSTTSDSVHAKDTAHGAVADKVVVNHDPVYSDFQVEKPAMAKESNPLPVYPPKLEIAGIEGTVLVEFVIDTMGKADMSTFKVLRTRSSLGRSYSEGECVGPCPSDKERAKLLQVADSLFTQSITSVMPRLRFYVAEKGERKVRQFVEYPFSFAKPHS